jgi:peptide/nickel transport system ATP-binding protein
MAAAPLLELDRVAISYFVRAGEVPAVTDVSLALRKGEALGLVGESGCGKSTLGLAILRYLGGRGRIVSGAVRFKGRDLAPLSEDEMRALRGGGIGMVYQEAMSALNPGMRVEDQLAEAVVFHGHGDWSAARREATEMLRHVRLADPERILRAYPHQLSGGQLQRVVIAMALLAKPDVLILDEPTTALDVTVEAGIVQLIAEIRARTEMALVFISHNLGLVAQVCDRVAVMYSGEIVEQGAIADVFARPRHPYTRGLLRCIPEPHRPREQQRLTPIRGQVSLPSERPRGCNFGPRCDSFHAGQCDDARIALAPIAGGSGHSARCVRLDALIEPAPAASLAPPPSQDDAPLVVAEGLDKTYTIDDRGLVGMLLGERAREIRANQSLSFTARRNRTLAIVGESGCGKSTFAKVLTGLEPASGGTLRFGAGDVARVPAQQRPRELLRALQMIFQNPDETLNPSYSVGFQIARVVRRFGVATSRDGIARRTRELLELTRLPAAFAQRRPRQLSGGQKQRVGIARAFAGDPQLVVADEPVSSLDVSVQAAITELLTDIQRARGATYVVISHDLGFVRYIADDIVVMYLGQVMEAGPVERIFAPPYHPYTEALLAAVPLADPKARKRKLVLSGELPSALDPPKGCPFHTRCPRKLGAICETAKPPEQRSADGHRIACHIERDELAKVEPIFAEAT